MGSSTEITQVESTGKPNWLKLPIDLTKNILSRLDIVEILTCVRNVCPLWWKVFKDPLMWRTIHTSNIHLMPFDFHRFEKIFRYCIDLSCGQVEDVDIELIGTDDLLNYMADR